MEHVTSKVSGKEFREKNANVYIYLFGIFLFCFTKKVVFIIKFPQQNMNQWETGIGDKKLSVELMIRNCQWNAWKSRLFIFLLRRMLIKTMSKKLNGLCAKAWVIWQNIIKFQDFINETKLWIQTRDITFSFL